MQKFQKGDLVQVAKDLGQSMSHFTADCRAIVIGSYADQYPQYSKTNTKDYTLFLEGEGECSWYGENQLTLIESGRLDLLEEWEQEQEDENTKKGDLDWIFTNGAQVLKEGHGASVAALAKCFGLTNLWGSRGEGFVYYQNAMGTIELARPFLEAGDKEGWLKHCAELVANRH